MNGEVEVDDPLSKSTSRLSICQADMEELGEKNPRLQVREFLKNEGQLSRRDSAVSLNSFVEDDTPKAKSIEKRRRSSVQTTGITQQPAKKEKIHKRKLRKLNHPPTVELNPDTAKESDTSEGDDGKRFPFKNIRQLILQIFNVPPTNKLKWCKLGNPEKIPTICFCLVPGLQLEDRDNKDNGSSKKSLKQLPISYLKKIDELPFIYDNFETFIRSMSPGTKDSVHSPLQAITNVPLTKYEKKSLMEKSQKQKITIRDLLLAEQQLVQHNYPRKLADDTWKETQPHDPANKSHIYALDCEFCKAGTQSVLTRISLIDFQGEVVFDELVKPEEEITDYVTKYSGITEEMLKDVTTTIHDIQDLFLKHVSSEDILVGHSLESDLNVMKIMHSKVVDTSIIYEHNRGPPSKPSLRWLAQQYLKSDIQTGEDHGHGHSSIEDAKACLDLVKLKIQNGRLFGTNVGEISIFSRLSHNSNFNGDFKSLWVGYPNPRGPYLDLEDLKLTKISAKNDDEIVDNFLKEIPNKKFAVVNLRDLELNSRWGNAPEYYSGDLDYDQVKAFQRTNERLTKIYEALPEWSVLICYSQSGDPRGMYKLQAVRRDFQKLAKENVDVSTLTKEQSWDADKLDLLLKKTALARESLTFIKVKPSNGITEEKGNSQ
ncbi:conserved hypothetical protein [Candida tropicalis MYA-3404]|uniref:Exonuclease domain-containing protein n=1 Tax=Candida tropicalis (strain ATCC MYA-3404 / T1) TaxID=294747 RepID=C5MCL7_CANTT|nr:conserved hypothetical protein [Candida tropicalis MYA-3404]EER32297.1 conserved hypothetical protein [Candida tropicalis MYA-3404]KAG4405902.1 hypothetical protein JTP64_004773 [Candida tropicalis]